MAGVHRSHRIRYSMQGLLAFTLIMASLFGVKSYFDRERERVFYSISAMFDKGVDIRRIATRDAVVEFKNANVTDDDLTRFVPAIRNNEFISGVGRITELRLNGSPVTDAGVSKLHRIAPHCKISR